MLTLGIDPGMDGAFAWVTDDGHLVAVEDMPVIEVRGKRRISAAGVASLMRKRPVSAVVIEDVVAMPRRRKGNGKDAANPNADEVVSMGAVSMINYGRGAGILEGAAAAHGLPVSIFAPRTWKSRADAPADKNECRARCSRLWPGSASLFVRKKDNGRADASLLAHWAATNRIGIVHG